LRVRRFTKPALFKVWSAAGQKRKLPLDTIVHELGLEWRGIAFKANCAVLRN